MSANKNGTIMVKTEEVLKDTVLTLLKKHNLENITVSDICVAAQINRAVFYAYFADKYDLMNYCLNTGTPSESCGT